MPAGDRADVDDVAAPLAAHDRHDGRQVRKWAFRSTASVRSHSSSARPSIRPGRPIAGVVDEHVDAAEARQHAVHHRLHVAGAGDVGGVAGGAGPPSGRSRRRRRRRPSGPRPPPPRPRGRRPAPPRARCRPRRRHDDDPVAKPQVSRFYQPASGPSRHAACSMEASRPRPRDWRGRAGGRCSRSDTVREREETAMQWPGAAVIALALAATVASSGPEPRRRLVGRESREARRRWALARMDGGWPARRSAAASGSRRARDRGVRGGIHAEVPPVQRDVHRRVAGVTWTLARLAITLFPRACGEPRVLQARVATGARFSVVPAPILTDSAAGRSGCRRSCSWTAGPTSGRSRRSTSSVRAAGWPPPS